MEAKGSQTTVIPTYLAPPALVLDHLPLQLGSRDPTIRLARVAQPFRVSLPVVVLVRSHARGANTAHFVERVSRVMWTLRRNMCSQPCLLTGLRPCYPDSGANCVRLPSPSMKRRNRETEEEKT